MEKIKLFNELHHSENILFLGNAWDPMSALALEKAGFQAIGTTSWGIAQSLGVSDGELLDFEKHLQLIKQIVECVEIPVTADIESGYSEDPVEIVYNVLKTADSGVAGINIEDSFKKQSGLRTVHEQSRILYEARKALDQQGFKDFYLNARTDTYLQKENPLLETMARAKAYAESGASGIFVPGLIGEEEIQELVSSVTVPLNLMSLPQLTNCQRLHDLGVKRFSFGNALYDKVNLFLKQSANQLTDSQDTVTLYE